jgi:hypothetical protein
MTRAERLWLVWCGVVVAIFLLASKFALARDLDGRYAQSEHGEWVKSLRNKNGMGCCDEADGFKVEDPDWRNVGNEYEVKLEGKWVRLEDHQILTDPNRLGFAMVWIWRGNITCFLPGARG